MTELLHVSFIPGTAKPNDGDEGDEGHDGAEDEGGEEAPVAGDDVVPLADARVHEAGHVLQVDLVGHGVRQEGQLQHRVQEEVRQSETDLDPIVILGIIILMSNLQSIALLKVA